ncbi:hypothetical protein; putative Flavoprotein domain [Frankia alni ACN14a]|uniref:NADPH-dependent FMN reductase-like domain-containing protein n=1 Tax=Frankia alni (strain DSM 45986 / CECT 9034 / ACN14a) TaxID=326424 RepID=Q0RHC9_FRAAA|nr:hypothetical protein; putative Flavoprotein domain [Frankia alni ACN14a]
MLAADGYLLGTPANIGYLSGALKHFFDQIYYPCLEATVGRPYALYVHGNSDTTGAVRGVETITTGLKWKRLREPLPPPSQSPTTQLIAQGGPGRSYRHAARRWRRFWLTHPADCPAQEPDLHGSGLSVVRLRDQVISGWDKKTRFPQSRLSALNWNGTIARW